MAYIPINFGMSNLGNTAGSSGMVSHQLVFAGGNNITLSGSTNAGSATVSVVGGAGGAGGNNTFGMSNLGNTAGSSGVITGSALQFAFAGGNNVTLSQSVNGSSATITFSAPSQSVQTQSNIQAFYDGTNSISSGTVRFSNSNGVSFGLNGQTFTASHNGITSQSVQTQNMVSVAGSTGNIVFGDANNITFGENASTITASASFNQTNQSLGLYAVSNTTQNSSATADARSLSFAGAGIASVGATNNSVVISVPAGGGAAFSAGASNIGNTAGNTGTVSNQLIFAGGNNITLSQSTAAGGATVTISGPSPAAGVTMSTWEPWPIHNTGTAVLSANTNTSGSASFIPFVVDQNVAAGYVNMILSANLTTGGTSSYNQSGTNNYAIYSRGAGANSTTISQVTSGSWSYQVSYNNSSMTVSQPTGTSTSGYAYGSTSSAGVNLSSGYTGLKLVQMPISTVLTPGVYWLGLFDRASSSSFNSGFLRSYYGNAYTLTGLAPIGSLSSAYTSGTNVVGGNGNWMQGFGVYTSAGLTNLPSTVALSNISQNASVLPYIKFVVS